MSASFSEKLFLINARANSINGIVCFIELDPVLLMGKTRGPTGTTPKPGEALSWSVSSRADELLQITTLS